MDVEHNDHWVELDPDLLDEIVKRVNYGDHIRLRTVCKKWSLEIPKNPKHVKNPWLILPSNDENEIVYSLFNHGEGTFHHLELPEMQKTETIFSGSYYEWLITLAIDGALRILNPFTRAQFDLPPLTTFPDVKAYEPYRLGEEYTVVDIRNEDEEYTVEKKLMQTSQIWKIIISASPNHDDQDFVAMAIYGEYGRLAWCRIGDSRWTDVSRAEITCNYEDAIFHEGKIYVVDYFAQMFEFNMKTGLGGINAMSTPSGLYLDSSKENLKYLVGTPSGLLMVVRRLKYHPKHIVCDEGGDYNSYYRTSGFEIYKLNRGEWLKTNGLGNHVILLGQNSSLCISPDNFPNGKGNLIYFTDDYKEFHCRQVMGGHDIGIFNLEDGSINHLYPNSHCIWPLPVWLLYKAY